MKSLGANLFLGICLSLAALNAAQVAKDGERDYVKFLTDPAKPYAYLQVDHVGPRMPLRDGEPNVGIWLRLKNNSKLPIAVLAVGTQAAYSQSGIILEDEIIPNIHASGGGEDARMAGLSAPPGLSNAQEIMDVFRWPNRTEEEVKSAERSYKAASERPRGYNFYNGFESFQLTMISPGDEVLFSVPANHVSKDWHIEIPFRLAVPNNSRIRPPYSYLAFYQEDLKNAQAATPTTH